MDSLLSTPDDRAKRPTRKITYSTSRKRNRDTLNQQLDSDSDCSSASKSVKSSAMSTPGLNKSEQRKRGPKKVDVGLPGPSPVRRDQQDTDALVKSPKIANKRRARASTVTDPSPREVTQLAADSSSTQKHASATTISTLKPRSRAKSVAAEGDLDDNASIADSAIGMTRTRRSEAERIEYYKNQPECGSAEPHAAQCTRCGKTVKLGRKQTYAVRPWELHRARCDQKPSQVTQPTSVFVESHPAPQAPEVIDVPVTQDAAPSTPHPTSRLPSEQDRKIFLEAEKQIKQLEKNRALCAKCEQWITLSETTAYSSSNWMKHKMKCFDIVPSNRVAAAKRKLLLVNDSQAKSFTARTVNCNNCGSCVTLQGEGDFNLAAWNAHKEQCTKSIPILRSEATNIIVSSSMFSRLSGSSSTIPVVPENSTLLGSGGKRTIDEVDAIPETERPVVRQKLETTTTPEAEPPNSLLGWFMLPFNSFVRGFKESLRDRS